MRSLRFASFPDGRADPANRGEDHVHDGAEHEDLECAVPIAEPGENQAERAVAQREDEPGDEARCQQVARPSHESKYGDCGEKAKRCGGGDVPFPREVIQHGNAIGKNEPNGEDQTQEHTGVNTRTDGRVAENVKPAESW